MKEKEKKLYEFVFNQDGIRFRHTNPNPMSAEQKFYIIMILAACVTFCVVTLGFFGLLH